MVSGAEVEYTTHTLHTLVCVCTAYTHKSTMFNVWGPVKLEEPLSIGVQKLYRVVKAGTHPLLVLKRYWCIPNE